MLAVRFSRGSGLAGFGVRLVTWSAFAHVGLRLPDGTVWDSTPEFGVSFRRAVDDADTRYFQIAGLTEKVAQRMLDAASVMVGQPYDFTGAAGVLFHRDWRRDGSWDCSEAVQHVTTVAGLPLLRPEAAVRLSRITPRDLLLSPLLWETSQS